uniref:Uracil-DNA glycosylase-like domain-containing protein n=1 Tax=Human herpesvirus 3 TaxID=10335 RepID=B0CMW7_HHV3|nr:unknown [Human alphaherpesvirus 3]WKR23906.1 uracil-DNA glycosylase [Human alphaherpesvirus 3]
MDVSGEPTVCSNAYANEIKLSDSKDIYVLAHPVTKKTRKRPRGLPLGVKLDPPTFKLNNMSHHYDTETFTPVSSQLDSVEVFSKFNISPEWYDLLSDELKEPYAKGIFLEYNRLLNSGEEILPSTGDIFAWTRFCGPQSIRVVIIGQDPYPTAGHAHGLAFSVKRGITPPSSLKNIFAALMESYPNMTPPTHGCLESWARQGVLLLNTTLTVRRGTPGSHVYLGWGRLVQRVLQRLCENRTGLVFMLWGAHAQKTTQPNSRCHLVLTHAHPSPLSRVPFRNCRHFVQANEYFTRKGEPEIDWSVI